MYADQMTDSMKKAIEETNRRREVQRAYNEEHGITPRSVKSAILDLSAQLYDADPMALPLAADDANDLLIPKEIKRLIEEYTKDMQRAADEMEFEKAAAVPRPHRAAQGHGPGPQAAQPRAAGRPAQSPPSQGHRR